MSKDLCEELIVEIFLRLPPKSLLRFRSVSKSLCDRIDSPDFIRLHTLLSPKKFMFIHQVRDKGFYRKNMYTMHSEAQLSSYADITPVDYPFMPDVRIVGSCNGLVCLYDVSEDVIYLWNPSIRRKLTLHKLPYSSSHARRDPFKFTHGFGFDPIIDNYKIVRISRAGSTFVYTMKMSTWREVASPSPPFHSVYSFPCLFNGALHWVTEGYSGHHYFDYVLRFDLSSEIFSTIGILDMPRSLVKEVCIIKGCLAVIRGTRIWVRNTPAASWSSLVIKVDEDDGRLQSAHGDILFSRYYEGIMVYNPVTEARSRLVNLGDHHDDCTKDMITCTESLALLNMGNSCDVIKGSKSSKRVKFSDLIKGFKSSKRQFR